LPANTTRMKSDCSGHTKLYLPPSGKRLPAVPKRPIGKK
jgi:hypothetical protein